MHLFKSDGTLLSSSDLTYNLASGSSSSYLSDLLSGDVDVWLEGLHKDTDFKLSLVYKNPAGTEITRDDVQVTIADWTYKNADNQDASIVVSVPPQNLSEWINDPTRAIDVPNVAQVKNSVDGLAPAGIATFEYKPDAGTAVTDDLSAGTATQSSISKNFTIAYRPAQNVTLTADQISTLKQQKHWDVISDAAGRFNLSTTFDIQSHRYIKDAPDLKLNAFANTYFTFTDAPETPNAMQFTGGLTTDSLVDAVLGRTWTDAISAEIRTTESATYDANESSIYVSLAAFNRLRQYVADDDQQFLTVADWNSRQASNAVVNNVIFDVKQDLAAQGLSADILKLLSPGEIYDLFKVHVSNKQAELAALQLLPPSPAQIRVYGVLRLLGGVGEIGGGSALAAIPSGVSQVAAIGVYAHAADTFWTGIREIYSGEQQRSYTSQIVSAGAEVVGVKHQTAILAGEFTDLGLGLIGSTGPLALNKLRGLRAVTALGEAGAATTVAAEVETVVNSLSTTQKETLIGYLKRALTVAVDTPEDKAIFWTGTGAEDAAKALAQSTEAGGYTLEIRLAETTDGTSLLNETSATSEFKALPRDAQDFVWRTLSRRFAEQAKGIVRVVNLHTDNAVFRTRVWATIEYPTLNRNPNTIFQWANPPGVPRPMPMPSVP